MSYVRPSVIILNTMRTKNAWVIPELVRSVGLFTGSYPSADSIRTLMSRLERDGAVRRIGRGAYCLPGNDPNVTELSGWVMRRLGASWPDMERADTLAAKFYKESRIRIPREEFAAELEKLARAGKIESFGRRKYGLFEAPKLIPPPTDEPVLSIFA